MLRQTTAALTGALLLVLSNSYAIAAPSQELISLYYQAALGDEDKTEQAFDAFVQLIEQEGATPLSLIYLGGTEALKGRDAFLPWNKLKYVEHGVANIDKGLMLMNAEAMPENQQQVIMGLPENILAKANAAAVLSRLPTMFNQFDKGYELYFELLDSEGFDTYSFEASSWIYRRGVEAALTAEDMDQARQWLNEMKQRSAADPETIAATELVANAE